MNIIYNGSVKKVMGPLKVINSLHREFPAAVFEFSDAYSIFDWGKMPNLIPEKGKSMAVVSADIFEKIARPSEWKQFSRTAEALALRKGITQIKLAKIGGKKETGVPKTLGAAFNEMGERLQEMGLRSHYEGLLSDGYFDRLETDHLAEGTSIEEFKEAPSRMLVRKVSVSKPAEELVMGRPVLDYLQTRESSFPRLIPLEVVFRFGCPEGSSLVSTAQRDPDYFASLPAPEEILDAGVKGGEKWDFPVVELFTKLESTDRRVNMTEALAMSGISAAQMQEMYFQSMWLAGFLKSYFGKAGFELADGKFEWGITEEGRILLVDSIGPDELRLLKGGVHFSKEICRKFYRTSSWYADVQKAKREAIEADWKKSVESYPEPLPGKFVELVSQLYQSLANELTSKKWFETAWGTDRVVKAYNEMKIEA